jgi:uncharacterized protein (UPF0264 family)
MTYEEAVVVVEAGAEIVDFATSRGGGLQTALAGSLGLQHAEALLDLAPDVIGVRDARV